MSTSHAVKVAFVIQKVVLVKISSMEQKGNINESYYYIIRPSNWANLPYMVLCLVSSALGGWFDSFWFLLGAVPYVWNAIYLACWSYSFSDDEEVLTEEKGVFSTEKIQVHYFRIKSIKVSKPFFLRIFGLSNVDVITSEPFKPYLRIYAIKDGDELAEQIESAAEYWRGVRGVKESDFHHF